MDAAELKHFDFRLFFLMHPVFLEEVDPIKYIHTDFELFILYFYCFQFK